MPQSHDEKLKALLETRGKIEKRMSNIKNKIMIMSGKGGVGKTTVSVNLAVALAEEGFKVGLLDIDLHGPNVVTMVGYSSPPDVDANNNIIPARVSENLLVISMGYFLEEGKPTIWRGPIKISAINQFLGDVMWGELDYLIIDAPPGSGDEPLTVMQNVPDVKILIVATPQKVALQDVRRSVTFAETLNKKILGVVENMSYLICPHCGERVELFGRTAMEEFLEETGVTLLARLPFDPKVAELADSGKPVVSWYRNSRVEEIYRELVEKLLEVMED